MVARHGFVVDVLTVGVRDVPGEGVLWGRVMLLPMSFALGVPERNGRRLLVALIVVVRRRHRELRSETGIETGRSVSTNLRGPGYSSAARRTRQYWDLSAALGVLSARQRVVYQIRSDWSKHTLHACELV